MHVQRAAVNWLASYYEDKVGVQAVRAETEVAVRADSKLGSGRADGLVAALMADGSLYTATLEAKSTRTLRNFSLRYRDGQWLLHALVAGLVALLVAGSIGWLVGGTWLLRWALPIAAFVAATFAYLFITAQHARYRLIDVIRQVKRYPANEQWVAVSADAYNSLADDLQDALRSDCRREGIGLLQVRSATRVTQLEEPRPRTAPTGLTDFPVCYSRSGVVRQKLHSE